MKRREMEQLLTERIERITLLELRIDIMEQLVEGYHAREQAIIDALRVANETAARIREKADANAAEAAELAKKRAEETVVEAGRRAEEQIAQARAEGEKIRLDAEVIKREYEELITSFNAMLEQNASELQETAAKFAEFVKGRRIDSSDSGAFYRTVGEAETGELPEPSDDPARLMHNIYRLQNRPLPTEGDGVMEPPAEEPAEEEAMPFSEAAWASSERKTPLEPQAEFERLFDEVFLKDNAPAPAPASAEPADETAPAGGAAVRRLSRAESQAEVQRAFDSLFSQRIDPELAQDDVPPEAAEGPQGGVPAPVAPAYSEAAWASEATTSPAEPQAEFSPADIPEALFAPLAEPVTMPETPAEPFSEAAWASEAHTSPAEPQAEFTSAAMPEPPIAPPAEPAPAPEPPAEPFSETAWASETHTSPTEPQAEFTPAFDPAFVPTDYTVPAEPECAPRPLEAAVLPEAPAAPQPIEATKEPAAPYSESAWASETHTSETEPQAEGALAFDAAFPRTDEETYPRGFESAEEPREWEPEREPDLGDVPTVKSVLPESDGDDDVSLDDLLEEIIKAGE